MSSPVLAESGDLTSTYRALCSAIDYSFVQHDLLDLALTHRSWCAEHDGAPSNERLEFLGDAVLGLSITDSLYHNDPSQAEGQLAKARAEVVSSPVLASIARSLDLGPLLRLGRGEELSGGRDKESILADAMEAVMAAVYLDGGWEAARRVVVGLLAGEAAKAQTNPGERDYKTRLQELAAGLSMPSPQYQITSTGPDHGRMFLATVEIGTIEGRGSGTSKKQAQQRAAEQALELLDAGHEPFDGETDPVETAAVRSGGTQ